MRSVWMGRAWVAVKVLVVVGLAYALATNSANGDSYLSFPAARSIVHDQDLYLDEMESDLEGTYFLFEVGDHRIDYMPWAVAFVAVPSVLVLDAAHAVGIGPGSLGVVQNDQMTQIQIANGSAATLMAVLVVLALAFQLAPGTEAERRRVAVWIALGFGLATTAWSVTSRANWQHGPSMACTGLAVLAAVRLTRGYSWRWAIVLGAAAGAAYAIRPTNLGFAVAFGAWLLVTQTRRVPAALLGAAVVLTPWFAVNQSVWDSWLPPYHRFARADFGGNLPDRMATQLFSPARGLVLFSPVVVLALFGWWRAIRRREGAERLVPSVALALSAACCAQLLAVSSQPFDWWGGVTFGPRFMSDTLPWLAALSVPAVVWLLRPSEAAVRSGPHRVALGLTVAALVWSVVVHAQGANLRSAGCWNFDPDVDADQMWAWSNSQLFAGIGAVGEAPVGSLFTEPCDRMPRV